MMHGTPCNGKRSDARNVCVHVSEADNATLRRVIYALGKELHNELRFFTNFLDWGPCRGWSDYKMSCHGIEERILFYNVFMEESLLRLA
jgi:hypothetical protein